MDWNPDWQSAIASIESAGSGNYGAVGPLTKKGNRAYGRYQVMDFNIPSWTKKYFGQELTPEQFLSSPEAQDAVFKGEFGSYVNKYGNPQDAASMWFTGRPAAEGSGRSDILGTTGASYVSKFNKALGSGDVIADGIASDAMTAIGKQPKGILSPKATNNTETQPMMQQQRPRGLLGSLGIQKMQEGAAGETGQRFFERDTFKDTAATLAQSFAAMGSNPALQKMTADIASQRSERRARNKTVEYLRKNNRADLADMVEKGLIGGREAAAQLLRKDGPVKGVAVGDKLVNPMTGEVIYEDTSAPGFDPKAVVTARKEFVGLPEVKQFAGQTSAYGRVIASVEDPSPAGDLALIFNFMKVLDPGSVVREGEFATAQNAGSIDERTRSLYNRIVSGERLTPEQRSDFADRATKLYTTAQGQYENVAQQYSSFAEAAGLPVEQVIPDFSYSGGLYQKPLEFSRPPAPAGISPEDWASAWSNMTDAERREFVER